MITLKNNTKSVSKIGYVVSLDPNDRNAFVYVSAGAVKAIGVVTEAVAYRKPCKIATLGDTTKVFVAGNVVKGNILRTVKSTDRASLGTAVIVGIADAPYLRIGEALNSARGLVSCVLDFSYLTSDTDFDPDDYVPYTGATGDVNIGTHGITSGSAIIGGATDKITIDASGNMSFGGDATVWDDVRIVPSQFDRPGVTDPTIQDWQPAGSGTTFKVWCFNQTQAGYFTCQLPHSYKEGSDIHVHCHWTPKDRGVAEDIKTVAWKMDYSWANIDGTFGASATADMTDTCTGTNHKHKMTPSATLTGTSKNISSMLVCKIYRDSGDTWVGTTANGPALLELDFHFEADSFGSKTVLAK